MTAELTPAFLSYLRGMDESELLAFTAVLSTRDWRLLTELDIAEVGNFIRTDGCTGTFDFYLRCCILHDWWYRTHRDLDGSPVTKLAADRRLRDCIASRSILGWWNPMAHWRYWAVRKWGRKAWQ